MNKVERQESIDRLKEIVEPGDTIDCILRHVSKSGMMRRISFVKIKDGESISLDYLIARACDYKRNLNHEGLTVRGCGMDMGFSVVYDLSSTLYADGFTCIGKRKKCPSNDHSNGDQNYRKHNHKSGGYALRHRWL